MPEKKGVSSLEKLRELITSSKIPLNEQNDLLIFLPALPQQALDELAELFEKYPELLYEFNENFKAKLNILINGRDQWEKLISEEEGKLEEWKEKYPDEF